LSKEKKSLTPVLNRIEYRFDFQTRAGGKEHPMTLWLKMKFFLE